MSAIPAGALVLLAAALIGCGDTSNVQEAADAAAAADSGDAGDSVPDRDWIAPPAKPALARCTPCPAGWRELVIEEGARVCEPWPVAGRQACAPDEAHFPGEPGCSPIGSTCPADEWPDDLPAAGVLYVRAGAPAGGAGTRDAPLGRISDAAERAVFGAVIAVSAGTYEENDVRLRSGVTLRGACARDVRIVAVTPSSLAGAVTIVGHDVVVRDVTLSGARMGVWAAGGAASGTIEGVLIDGASSQGIQVGVGGSLVARSLVVRNTIPSPMDGVGNGVVVSGFGRVEVDRAVIERMPGVGVAAYLAGAVARVTRTALLDFAAAESIPGIGLAALGGGRVEAQAIIIERAAGIGVYAEGELSSLQLEDLVVRDGGDAPRSGRGLEVDLQARASVARMFIDRSHSIATHISERASVDLRDFVVRDVSLPEAPFQYSPALELYAADVSATRVVAIRAEGTGIHVEEQSTLKLEDAVVSDTRPFGPDGTGGRSIAVLSASRLDASRVRIARSGLVAISVEDAGSSASVIDATIDDTLGESATGIGGRAIDARGGGVHVSVARARIDGSHDVGIAAFEGASVVLQDLIVTRTLARVCATTTCTDAPAGISMGAYSGASVDARLFRVTDGALCGVQLATGGVADLHAGEIARHMVGANVQTAGFDAARLQDGVSFVDDAVMIDMSALPVPEPLVPAPR